MKKEEKKEKEVTRCLQCGKVLTGIQRFYCSQECGKKAAKARYVKPKMKDVPKPKISKAAKERRFQKAVAEANKQGISYGQLKAREYIDKNGRFTL